MYNENNRYSHLYKTVQYIPPSVIREIEKAKPNANETYSKISVNRGNSLESVTGQSGMDRLFNVTLKGKEVYNSMKNKIMYSLSSEVVTHEAMNRL